jgi:hypothetical protein
MAAQILEQVVEINRDYLGPAAERFVERQISIHLKKKPQQITARDLDKLIDWLKLSFALLTDNTKLVDEYTHRLKLVAQGKGDKAVGKEWNPS